MLAYSFLVSRVSIAWGTYLRTQQGRQTINKHQPFAPNHLDCEAIDLCS